MSRTCNQDFDVNNTADRLYIKQWRLLRWKPFDLSRAHIYEYSDIFIRSSNMQDTRPENMLCVWKAK